MWYEDLTPYEYYLDDYEIQNGVCVVVRTEKSANLLNVGWLSRTQPFERGKVPDVVIDSLAQRCLSPVKRMRGYCQCAFCDQYVVTVEHSGNKFTLGSAEIRVTGLSGITYAAPNMILHYVRDHEYRPPDEFIDAVLFSRLPTTEAE